VNETFTVFANGLTFILAGLVGYISSILYPAGVVERFGWREIRRALFAFLSTKMRPGLDFLDKSAVSKLCLIIGMLVVLVSGFR
jgi:hypothetical protein